MSDHLDNGSHRTIEFNLNPILGDKSNEVISSKYTLFNFLPKNLFEQFRRLANLYFLGIALIQVTTNSPVSPLTSLVPLIFVIATTALKQGYEDFCRHQSDAKANNVKVPVYKECDWNMVRCSLLRSGCVVQVTNNAPVPCDMVLLHSSSNAAWVTTASLDGETTLKYKEPCQATQSMSVNEYQGHFVCEPPNADLYEFNGTYVLRNSAYPLTANNLLLRGSRLENTSYVYGIAIYTGSETRMSLNSQFTSNKFSSLEHTVNRYLLFYFFVLFVISTGSTICYVNFSDQSILTSLQLNVDKPEPLTSFFIKQWLNFFVIFNYLIPISLYVSLEMVKFFGSKRLVNDPFLHRPRFSSSHIPRPVCNSSDLNEELGQIEYLFSDKTGTLTENIMRLKAIIYEAALYSGEKEMESVPNEIFIYMCLCSSVKVIQKNQDRSYVCESPDEKALIDGAKKSRITHFEIEGNYITLKIGSDTKSYTKLRTLDFDTFRKRMSVIVRDEFGKLLLICKGADSTVLTQLSGSEIAETYSLIDKCACDGLRILVFGIRELTEEEWDDIDREYRDAQLSFNRKEKMRELYNFAERNLQLVGATAVEDSLQEGVVDTIKELKRAGIKVWVLTGDKLETAVSVSYSCGLLDDQMTQLVLSRQSSKETCKDTLDRFNVLMNHKCIPDTDNNNGNCQVAREFKEYVEEQSKRFFSSDKDHSTSQTQQALKFKSLDDENHLIRRSSTSMYMCHSPKYALILDGRSLYLSLSHHRSFLHDLCLKCDVVICSRVSPLQKAEVVSLMRPDGVSGAIGDGANDISMLQQASVGIGIAGNEGRQAVDAGDIGLARFGDLRRVLFVHGSIFYVRLARLVHYFFYKNVVFVTPQVVYAYNSGFTAQTLYHGMLLMWYNMILTALPIFIYGLYEEHLPDTILVRNPELYRDNYRNALMTFPMVFFWFISGLIHGLVSFYGYMFFANQFECSDLALHGLFAFGTVVYHIVIFTVTAKLLIVAQLWNRTFLCSILFSILLVFACLYAYSFYDWRFFGTELFGLYPEMLRKANFWLPVLVTLVLAIIPDICLQIFLNHRFMANRKGLNLT